MKKEDKFILVCVVCLVVFCKFWMLFANPWGTIPRAADNITVTEQSFSDKGAEKNDVKADEKSVTEQKVSQKTEVNKDIKQTVSVTTAEKNETAKKTDGDTKGKFIGCGSSFSSSRNTSIVNGEKTAQYSAQNTITCTCDLDGLIVERIVRYQYTTEPQKVELDCNSKCGSICAQN